MLPRIAGAAFSTSSILSYPPPKAKKAGVTVNTKGAKTLRIKKKAVPVRSGKPPASGERKAMRKRVVLSNTNALEVENLRDLSVELIGEMIRQKGESGLETEIYRAYGEDHGVAGQVVGLQDATVDALRASEAFKPTQGWGIFRRPGLLIRKESVELSKKLVDAQYDKSMVRLVLDGDRGTGKSLMLIHAMATAFTKGWIVLNIPEGKPCLS
jgi:small subunit ribosomal protein S29